MITRAGAFDLVSRFVQETTFLGPVEPQHGGCGSSRPKQMCSNGDVHEHRNVADGTHVLKGARDSQARDAAGGQSVDARAARSDAAAVDRQYPGYQIEDGAHAGAVRADEP